MRFDRRARLLAPVAVAGAIALGSWGTTLTSASATPDLPAISAPALVTKALSAKVGHLSGTVTWTADLGLPSLSSVTDGGGQSVPSAGGFDPTSLLSGTHSFGVAVAGGGRLRLTSASPLQESDLVVNGDQAWLSDSATGRVRHYVAAGTGRHGDGTGMAHQGRRVLPSTVADSLLAHVRAWSTRVATTTPVSVAGHAAYQLVLSPQGTAAAASTVSRVTVAVDASTGLPLQVTVYGVGQAEPALQLGFTSLSYGEPPASDFTALSGLSSTTTVVKGHGNGRSRATTPSRDHGLPNGLSLVGTRWSTVVELSPSTTARALGPNGSKIDSLTTQVSGTWGHGRLLTSSLLNALVLPDGHVLAGLVTPAALEHAAASL